MNTGDTAWMLTSTCLVLLMTLPGVALLYGGMVSKKNIISTITQTFMITCLVTLLWFIVGYSLSFSEGSFNSFVGGFSNLFLKGVSCVAHCTWSNLGVLWFRIFSDGFVPSLMNSLDGSSC